MFGGLHRVEIGDQFPGHEEREEFIVKRVHDSAFPLGSAAAQRAADQPDALMPNGFQNNARDLLTAPLRSFLRRGVTAAVLLHQVGPVDYGGVDFDNDFSVFSHWIRHFTSSEIAVSIQEHCMHFSFSSM